jgi:polyisoprenoid-binding protein YceI
VRLSKILSATLRSSRPIRLTLLVLAACAAWAQPKAIDAVHSTMTVHVFKAGMLSAFGHDHEISAPIAEGSVDTAARKVELRVDAGGLRVVDAKASEKDRGEIQTTMLGAEVLDAQKYNEIRFRSTSAQSSPGAWTVAGDLTLHGQTKAVTVQVREEGGRYSGSCKLKITDFGIAPVKAAGGAVRVKDEVQIDFDIQLAAGSAGLREQ